MSSSSSENEEDIITTSKKSNNKKIKSLQKKKLYKLEPYEENDKPKKNTFKLPSNFHENV